MQVLVTGATGFTGGHLARALNKRGHRVRAMVRDRRKGAALEREGIELVDGNLMDAAAVRRATRDCSVVYHIAALYREARHANETYRKVNVEGTGNVVNACQEQNVGRLVHCSTV